MTPIQAALLQAIAQGEPSARVVIVSAPEGHEPLMGREALVRAGGPPLEALDLGELTQMVLADAHAALATRRHTLLSYPWAGGRVDLFVEVQATPPTLIIVGAGHIAQPLAALGSLCDFRVAVIDDRPRYANRQRFPQAAQVIVGEIEQAVRDFPVTPDSYVVLVTRGHQYDMQALLQLLPRQVAYLGLIGSQRRVRGLWELVQTDYGVTADQLTRVYAPIGLDIGAESPAEIAVAIMAEIIMVRRGGSALPLSDALRARGGRIHTARIGTQKKRTSED